MLGSVEQEGTAIRVAERGHLPSVHRCGIHVVLASEPSITVLGSTKAPLPTTSTWQGKLHCFYIPSLALGSTLASSSFIIPTFLARHCAFHAPASFDAAGKPLPRWTLALAQEAERWYLSCPSFAWHLCVQTIYERCSSKAHRFIRSSIGELPCLVL